MIQEDWDNPDVEVWGDRMAKFASGATQPVVVVAHSLGVPAVVYAADNLKRSGVIGAFPRRALAGLRQCRNGVCRSRHISSLPTIIFIASTRVLSISPVSGVQS